MMIRLGLAAAVVGPGDTVIASAVALPYPPEFGWISMVLVDVAWRRRGLATSLLERAIAELQDRGLVPCLDATPAGQPVYERMGFRPVEPLTRWRRHGDTPLAEMAAPSDLGRLDDIRGLDENAFGADRSAVLSDLLSRRGSRCLCDPGRQGFLLARAGRKAAYIGPVVATDAALAIKLIETALAAPEGPTLIDVPDRESEVADLLLSRGFSRERPFIRMAIGRMDGFGSPAAVRAIAGPELG